MKNEFRTIFEKYDTDKSFYSEAYSECFSGVRNDVKLIFEIGVNRGGSVRAWKEIFPNALIVGLDINPDSHFEEDNIAIEIGNATVPIFVNVMIQKYGAPDIIIDDGSHWSSDIKASHELLYKHAKICYVIEDLVTQQITFENGLYVNDGVPATAIIHKAVDDIILSIESCDSMRVYHAICFFFKGKNENKNKD